MPKNRRIEIEDGEIRGFNWRGRLVARGRVSSAVWRSAGRLCSSTATIETDLGAIYIFRWISDFAFLKASFEASNNALAPPEIRVEPYKPNLIIATDRWSALHVYTLVWMALCLRIALGLPGEDSVSLPALAAVILVSLPAIWLNHLLWHSRVTLRPEGIDWVSAGKRLRVHAPLNEILGVSAAPFGGQVIETLKGRIYLFGRGGSDGLLAEVQKVLGERP